MGWVNDLTYHGHSEIFPRQSTESFQAAVRARVQSELQDLDLSAVLESKELLKASLEESVSMDAVNMRESYAQAARMSNGILSERFGKIARKELKHKL